MFEVSEGAQVDHRVGSVHATDCDVGSNSALEYVLGAPLLLPKPPAASTARRPTYSANAFKLSRSGELTLKRPLDREDVVEYRFAVLAVDQGAPRLNGTAEVLVQVRDENDNARV